MLFVPLPLSPAVSASGVFRRPWRVRPATNGRRPVDQRFTAESSGDRRRSHRNLHLARLIRPQDEDVGVYRYRLFDADADADGNEQGAALYAVAIEPALF